MADPGQMEEGLAYTEVANKDMEKKERGTDSIDEEKDGRVSTDEVQEQNLEQQPLVKQKTNRVATLDAFRGLTIVLMILVDDAGEAYSRIDHSPWNGCTLADLVMPFFLFIVGVAIALALKKIPKINDAIKKIFLRTLKLLFWGVLLQGGYSHAPSDLSYGVDMKLIRWCGILQRIALVYFIVALIETLTKKRRPTVLKPGQISIFSAYRWQWMGGFIAFIIYMITTYSLYVPDWSFTDNKGKQHTVKCGMRGHLGPACNAIGYVDRQVWGINHLYSDPVWKRLKACTHSSPSYGPLQPDAPIWCRAPFEPEGLLSSIMAILSGTIGIHYGHVLIHFKGHSERLKQWVSMAIGLLIVAIILDFTDAIPINKQLYSFSYVCFTAGAAGIVFSAFYILVFIISIATGWNPVQYSSVPSKDYDGCGIDVWGFKTPFLFLEWIGMNAMLIFVLGAQAILPAFVNGWYYESENNTLVYWIQKHIFNNVWHSQRLGTLLYVIFAEIVFYGVLSGILHKLGIYWKL